MMDFPRSLFSGYRSILFVVCIFLWANFLFALKIPKPTFGGNITTYYEINSASDKTRIRDPAYAYYFSLNSSLDFHYFNIGLGLSYFSDNKFTAQRIQQLSLNPSWKWGNIHIGDFSPTFSEFTINGVSVSGVGVEIFPKSFRFSFVGGQSKNASSNFSDFSYKRNLYGLKLGTSFLTLNILKAKDDTSSVKVKDTLPVPPQENLVVGLESNFSILKIFNFVLEGAGGINTRDLRSDTIYAEELPKFFNSFYKPRRSSRVDFALKGAIKFNLNPVCLDLSLNYIGPGFTSLGVPYMKNDSRKGRLSITTEKIPRLNIGLTLEREYDNLIKEKVATTRTNGLNLFLGSSPYNNLGIPINYQIKHILKEARPDSFKQNALTQLFSISPNFNFLVFGLNQNAGIFFTYQDYKNRVLFSQTPPCRNLTFALNYSITPKLPITFTTSFSQTINLSPQEEKGKPYYQNYSLTINQPLLNYKLNNTFNLAYQPATEGKNFCLGGSSSYSLTKIGIFNLTWNLSFFSSSTQSFKSFSTQKASLSYARTIF